MSPSRAEHRRLQRCADVLLKKFRGFTTAGPSDLIYLSPDKPDGLTIPIENRAPFLARLGLAELEAEIAAELRVRSCPGGHVVPILLVVEGWAKVAYQATYPLTRGGRS